MSETYSIRPGAVLFLLAGGTVAVLLYRHHNAQILYGPGLAALAKPGTKLGGGGGGAITAGRPEPGPPAPFGGFDLGLGDAPVTMSPGRELGVLADNLLLFSAGGAGDAGHSLALSGTQAIPSTAPQDMTLAQIANSKVGETSPSVKATVAALSMNPLAALVNLAAVAAQRFGLATEPEANLAVRVTDAVLTAVAHPLAAAVKGLAEAAQRSGLAGPEANLVARGANAVLETLAKSAARAGVAVPGVPGVGAALPIGPGALPVTPSFINSLALSLGRLMVNREAEARAKADPTFNVRLQAEMARQRADPNRFFRVLAEPRQFLPDVPRLPQAELPDIAPPEVSFHPSEDPVERITPTPPPKLGSLPPLPTLPTPPATPAAPAPAAPAAPGPGPAGGGGQGPGPAGEPAGAPAGPVGDAPATGLPSGLGGIGQPGEPGGPAGPGTPGVPGSDTGLGLGLGIGLAGDTGPAGPAGPGDAGAAPGGEAGGGDF